MFTTRGAPKVVVHAGTHKTGTTSIQEVLSQHRRELRKQGLVYPDTKPYLGGGRHAHHRFAHALVGLDQDALHTAYRFWNETKAAVRQDDTILLSSEAFYRHVHEVKNWRSVSKGDYWPLRTRYLSQLAEIVGDAAEVRVVLFLRRPDAFAESLYRENVTKSLIEAPFCRWLRHTHPLFHYDAQITAFSSVFPSVEVCRYEDAAAEGLVDAFFQQIGFVAPRGEAWTRRSPDARIVLWMHQRRPGTWGQRREFAMSHEALDLFDDYGATTLWQSTDKRDAFLQQFAGSYGANFFTPPTHDLRPATLSEEDARRIDAAWSRWRRRAGKR